MEWARRLFTFLILYICNLRWKIYKEKRRGEEKVGQRREREKEDKDGGRRGEREDVIWMGS